MRVVTVCGMGFGTSLMLLMTIKDIGKKYGVNIEGEAVDLGSYKGKPCDLNCGVRRNRETDRIRRAGSSD